MEKIINNWTEENFLEEYCKVLDKDEQFKGSTITKKEDGTIEIITKEKDKFIVTEDTVEYKGNIQENTPPTEEGNKEPPIVTIGTNGGTYTILAGNTTAEVTTTITVEDFSGSGIETLQYQFSKSETIPKENDVNWIDFANGETITQNLTGGISYLYTKVIDKAGNQAIDGHIIISYQWYGRKYNSTTWETISGATNANYDIPKTVTNFSSLYRYYSCVVTSTIDGQTTNKRSNEAELTYAASV